MGLLDLPPEIFQHIVHNLVQQGKPHGAWKLRSVCRTFAAEIEYNIFAKQTQDVFRFPGSINLMRKNKWLYLFYRSKFLLDADPSLPAKIKAMLDYLKDLELGDSTLTPNKLREILCKAMAEVVSLEQLASKGPSCSRNEPSTKDVVLTPFDKLAVLGAIGNVTLLKEALFSLKMSGTSTSDFGDVFRNSLAFDHPQVIQTITAYFGTLKISPSKDKETTSGILLSACITALTTAISDGTDETPIRNLLSFLKNYPFSLIRRDFRDMLRAGFRRGDLSIALALGDFGSEESGTVSHMYLEASNFRRVWRRSEGQDIIFRRNGNAVLTPSCDFVLDFLKHFMGIDYVWRNSTPLTNAIRQGDTELVNALLDAGANVDGVEARPGYYRLVPIEVAMWVCNLDVIQALLNHHANLRRLHIRSKYKSVYDLLREAKIKQTGVSVPSS